MIQSELEIFSGSTWIKYPIYNLLSFDERKDGQLATAGCTIITEANLKFKPQRKARLTVRDSENNTRSLDYFAYFTVQKRAPDYWLQSVILIEVSRKAQLEPIDGLRVIQDGETKTTLYDTLTRLVNTTPFRLNSRGNRYSITTDGSVVKVLKSVVSPEFAWSCRTLLWECLKEIGAAMGGYIPVLSFADKSFPSDKYEISFVNTSGTTKTVEKLDYKSYSFGVEEGEVCSETDSDIANIISTNQETASVVFPSQNSFISPRTEEVRLTTENCRLILPTTIERIVKVYIDATNLKFNYGVNSGYTTFETVADLIQSDVLDITHFVVERQLYDAIKEYNSLMHLEGVQERTERFKNNTIYWAEASNSIVVSTGTWKAQTLDSSPKPAIYFLIASAIYRNYKSDNGIRWLKVNDADFAFNHNITSVLSENRNEIRNLRFRVEYIPTDSSTKLRAVKQEQCDYTGVQIYNQRAEKVDSEILSADLKKSVNQRGVEYFKTVDYYSNLADILPLGTRYAEDDDNYEIVVNEYEQTNKQLIKVTHSWSKNWAMLSPRLMQNKEYRNTNIPTDILERNLHYEDFCIVSTTPFPNDDSPIITAGGCAALMRLWQLSNSETICEVNNFAIYRENGEEGAVSSCSSFAVANSIVFCGKTKSNMSIGIACGDEWENHDVIYADDDGKMTTALLQFGFTLSNTNNYSLPYSNRGESDYQNVISTTAAEGVFYIDKSSAEQTNFTYQLHFVSGTPAIVVGEGMASASPLIKGADGTETLKIWKLNKAVSKSAAVLTDGDGINLTVTASNAIDYVYAVRHSLKLYSVSFLFYKMTQIDWTDCPAWAVTDKNNRLIFACNEAPPTGANGSKAIYFSLTHTFHTEA